MFAMEYADEKNYASHGVLLHLKGHHRMLRSQKIRRRKGWESCCATVQHHMEDVRGNIQAGNAQ